MGRLTMLVFSMIAALALLPSDRTVAADQTLGLIFDTDIGNDVDDVLALGVIHALQRRGQCRLLAVTITKDNPVAAEFVDAVNTFYGYGDTPIGIVHNGMTKEEGKFLKIARIKDHNRFRFPHDLVGTEAPDATVVLRKVLSAQPDRSVAVVQVGFSTNLARLLDSKPDKISPLSGCELVRRKVRLLSMMAGDFRKNIGKDRFQEYNIKVDIPSGKKVVRDWPTPVVFSGYEIGIAIRYPAISIQRDYGYVAHHPLAEAYRAYMPPPHNRPTWDLTSVLYAVFPNRKYFDRSVAGRVTVEDDAFTRFDPVANGTHRYLIATPLQVERVREALVQLASEPPH